MGVEQGNGSGSGAARTRSKLRLAFTVGIFLLLCSFTRNFCCGVRSFAKVLFHKSFDLLSVFYSSIVLRLLCGLSRTRN